MLALRSCAYSMYTCIYAIYAVANITIDPKCLLHVPYCQTILQLYICFACHCYSLCEGPDSSVAG